MEKPPGISQRGEVATLASTDLEILELDTEGRPKFTYRHRDGKTQVQTHHAVVSLASGTSLLQKCLDPFLPAGYPSTVTPDYTPYQIYDSLQAFASTIAGLLASRAVFVGMGVGSEDASLVTTMLLYVAQETIGRVATILFAHRFSQRIEAEVKFYRFFADIVNDMAFTLDCISPGLPILGRVCTLCVSNACRAVCGVAGGSSKAVLSAHFAKAGNIGELNAKDGSQETVVSLIGMWVGGLLVSKVHGTRETWACLIPLLAFHLWANWKAVKSVRLHSLNPERAAILFGDYLWLERIRSVDEVGRDESVLGLRPAALAASGLRPGSWRIGASVADFLRGVTRGEGEQETSQSRRHLLALAEVFRNEDYLLWFDTSTGQGLVLLKESASGETQAQCYCHLLRCSQQNPRVAGPATSTASLATAKERDVAIRAASAPDDYDRNLRVVVETLRQNRAQWPAAREQLERAGWELGLTNLTEGRGHRIRLGHSPVEDKKDR